MRWRAEQVSGGDEWRETWRERRAMTHAGGHRPAREARSRGRASPASARKRRRRHSDRDSPATSCRRCTPISLVSSFTSSCGETYSLSAQGLLQSFTPTRKEYQWPRDPPRASPPAITHPLSVYCPSDWRLSIWCSHVHSVLINLREVRHSVYSAARALSQHHCRHCG